MARRGRTVNVFIEDVQPGERFIHNGQTYRRATDDETARHPAREHPRFSRGDIVLAYGMETKPTPLSFVLGSHVKVGG